MQNLYGWDVSPSHLKFTSRNIPKSPLKLNELVSKNLVRQQGCKKFAQICICMILEVGYLEEKRSVF